MGKQFKTILAKDVRPGDRIVHNATQYHVRQTDNVDGFIELVCLDHDTNTPATFMVKWDKQYTIWTDRDA